MKINLPITYVLQEGSDLYGRINTELNDKVASGSADLGVRLGEEITGVKFPPMSRRDATSIYAAREALEPHFIGQTCTASKLPGGVVDFERFFSLDRSGGKWLTPKKEAHLFEHLLLNEADKLVKPGGSGLTIDPRQFRFGEKGDPVLIINAAFLSPDFEDLVLLIWKLVAIAIKAGNYPTPDQLSRMMVKRRSDYRPKLTAS